MLSPFQGSVDPTDAPYLRVLSATPMKRRPEREHDELVVNLSRLSRLTGSGF
jgi:hypothetical protein